MILMGMPVLLHFVFHIGWLFKTRNFPWSAGSGPFLPAFRRAAAADGPGRADPGSLLRALWSRNARRGAALTHCFRPLFHSFLLSFLPWILPFFLLSFLPSFLT